MNKELREIIQKRINLLDGIIDEINLQKVPKIPGTLRISNTGNYQKYYHRESKGEKKGRYLRKDEISLARRLAQQSFDENMLKMAENEESLLGDFMRKYPEKTFDYYYDSLSEPRKNLINPIWIPDEVFVKQWMEQDYVRKGFGANDNAKFISNSGLRVRSKI